MPNSKHRWSNSSVAVTYQHPGTWRGKGDWGRLTVLPPEALEEVLFVD
jgi:hypothetical protein